ncbi:MAG: hypothetical protein FWC55_08815 [Firmicutes bacterium]|nr:hypothetical protein [Bacillota bacterium]
MAVNVGTAVAYLTLDTSGYRDAVAAAGETMRQFAQSSAAMGESIAALGAGARDAGAQVKAQAAAITGDYQKLGEAFRAGQAADSAFFRGELAARLTAADENEAALKARYDKGAEDYKAAETLKTANLTAELRKQEREVRLSQDANAAALKEYVPVWYSVGQEYANMLLSGIQATRDRIVSYLTDIASAVGSAGGGGDVSVGAYASGTGGAAPGLAVVGEEGPELVDFSGGEQILSFRESAALLNETAAAFGAAQSLAADYAFGGPAGLLYTGAGVKEIDYRRLAEEIAGAVKPSLTYSPTYNSPVEMSVAEMRRMDRVSAERMGFGF